MFGRFDYKSLVAAVYIISLFMQIMDATIINVAIPTLADEFMVTRSAVGWTVLSFVLALSVAIPAAGWLGDRYGLKKIFVMAMVGFTAASLLCGLAQSLEQLVAFRAIQGAFSGLVTPVGAALVFKAYPLAERAAASRKIITAIVIAPALGPVAGGAIVENFSWRWIFLVNLPFGALAVVLALRVLIEDRHPSPGPLDVRGLLLSIGGLGLLVFGISQGSHNGWTSPTILISLIASVVLLVTLVVTELHTERPLLALRLFRVRMFRAMNLLSLPIYAGFISLIFLLPLFLDAAGYSPQTIGLSILPQPIGVMLANQIAGRSLYERVGPRLLIAVGCFGGLITGVAFARLGLDTGLNEVRVLMFARGFAMGLIFLSIQTGVYAQIEPKEMSRATPLFSTVRQFAPALGVAIAATVLTSVIGLDGGGESTDPVVLERGYQRAMLASALMYGAALVLVPLVHDGDAAATRGKLTVSP